MKCPRWLGSLGVFLVALGATAHPIEHWTMRNGLSCLQNLSGIAHGNGTFVAVGTILAANGVAIHRPGFPTTYSTNGFLVTSTNGIQWEAKLLPTKLPINGILHAKGRFVAVGDQGTILWSEDGNSWSNVSLQMPHDITAIGFGNPTNAPEGLFVALATIKQIGAPRDNALSLVSNDGVSWQTNRVNSGSFSSTAEARVTSIAFSQGRFFAPWNYTAGVLGALLSENGSNWSQPRASVPNGITVAGDGKFVVAEVFGLGDPDRVMSLCSSNGFNWSPNGLNGFTGVIKFARGMCFADGQFVVVGESGYTGVSRDGTNWTVSVVTNSVGLAAVTHGNGVYVAVGGGRRIYTSSDGSSWIQRDSIASTSHQLLAVESADDICVAAGLEGIVAWNAGRFWQSTGSPTTNHLRAVLKARDDYICAGDLGTVISGDHPTNLVIRTSGTVRSLTGIASDTVTHVIVGDAGTVLTSEDAVHWEPRNSTVTFRLAAITHGTGIFVAVGDSGNIITSADGRQWSKRDSGTTRSFLDVAYGNGVFVAVAAYANGGAASYLSTSTNGIDWLPVANSLPGLSKVAYGNGHFVYPTTEEFILTRFNISTDGRTWAQRTFPRNSIGSMIYDLAYHRGAFVSVGSYGAVWQAEPLIRVEWNADSGSGNLAGAADGVFRVQATSHLESPADWTDLTNLTTFPYRFSDPEAQSFPYRFYRAISVEAAK